LVFDILVNLVACGLFFVVGLASGLAIARVQAGKARSMLLVVAGILVGGFLGYTYVLSAAFNIENRIESSIQRPLPD
jgi:hypothetical protein